jgi:hypothetical protein
LIRKDMTLNNTISTDLQSRLISLSSLVHDDTRPPQTKSSEVEEIGNIILKKIYAEDSNLPTSARLYLEQIASEIIDNKWSDIPPPVEMKFDFKMLKEIADVLPLASVGTVIDITELFGLLMAIKRDEAYNLAKIAIMDTVLSLKSNKAQVDHQASANKMELGAGIAAGALQCVQGCAQGVSSGISVYKNTRLAMTSKDNIDKGLIASKAEIELTEFKQTRNKTGKEFDLAEKNVVLMSKKHPPGHDAIKAAEDTRDKAKIAFEAADKVVKKATIGTTELNSTQKGLESSLTIKTDRARMWDQLRSSVIQGVKGGLDIGVAFVRFAGSEEKLKADVLEAAKNSSDRSANAMSQAAKNAADEVKSLRGTFEGIQQMSHQSIIKML